MSGTSTGQQTVAVAASCPVGAIAVGGSCDGSTTETALEQLDNGTWVFRDNGSAGSPALTLTATAHCIQ